MKCCGLVVSDLCVAGWFGVSVSLPDGGCNNACFDNKVLWFGWFQIYVSLAGLLSVRLSLILAAITPVVDNEVLLWFGWFQIYLSLAGWCQCVSP